MRVLIILAALAAAHASVRMRRSYGRGYQAPALYAYNQPFSSGAGAPQYAASQQLAQAQFPSSPQYVQPQYLQSTPQFSSPQYLSSDFGSQQYVSASPDFGSSQQFGSSFASSPQFPQSGFGSQYGSSDLLYASSPEFPQDFARSPELQFPQYTSSPYYSAFPAGWSSASSSASGASASAAGGLASASAYSVQAPVDPSSFQVSQPLSAGAGRRWDPITNTWC